MNAKTYEMCLWKKNRLCYLHTHRCDCSGKKALKKERCMQITENKMLQGVMNEIQCEDQKRGGCGTCPCFLWWKSNQSEDKEKDKVTTSFILWEDVQHCKANTLKTAFHIKHAYGDDGSFRLNQSLETQQRLRLRLQTLRNGCRQSFHSISIQHFS